MTSAEQAPPDASVVAKLQKRHADLLHSNESILGAIRCGAVDRAVPDGLLGMLGPVGRRMQRSLSSDLLEERARRVRIHLHRRGLEAVEFPASRVGYIVAMSEHRLLLFDASGRKFLSDAPARMYIDALTVDDVTILLFVEGREAAAVTVWEEPDDALAFVSQYRDRQRAHVGRVG